jgi:hypothetical protein
MDMDLLAASLRADNTDVGTFVEALAAKLEAALPGAVQVERKRDGLFGPKAVRQISVRAGDQRLDLERAGAALQTRIGRLSGGITLKSETVDTDAWLDALGGALAREAQHSQTTRQALERLLHS